MTSLSQALSLFDDAKLQRFSKKCNTFDELSVKKHSILDLNQALCAKTTDINTFIVNCEWLLRFLFVPFTVGESRLHLRKTQINLVFRSICTTFAPCEYLLLIRVNVQVGQP